MRGRNRHQPAEKRGTAEQHIKASKYAFHWAQRWCKWFRVNEVRLQLHALAHNLGTFMCCFNLPEAMADWSLTSLQLKPNKIGALALRNECAITFQRAKVAVTEQWSEPSLQRIADCERHRHARDRDSGPNPKTSRQVRPQRRKTSPRGSKRASSPNLPTFERSGDRRRGLESKTLDRLAASCDTDITRQATCGMSVTGLEERVRLFLFVVVALTSISGSVSAATMSATYEGVVRSGYDVSGVFGDPGVALDDEPFILSFVYDTLISRKGATWAGGGDFDNSVSPVLSTQIEIKGKSHEIVYDQAYIASIYIFTGLISHANLQGPGRSYFGGYQTSGSYASVNVEPVEKFDADLETSMLIVDFGFRGGNFRVGGFDFLTGEPWAGPSATGNLWITSLKIQEAAPSAVPLPSAGLLLLLAIITSASVLSLKRRFGNILLICGVSRSLVDNT